MTLLFAIGGGAAVGNLYWAQPLLAEIGASLHAPAGRASLLVTVTQIGYATGILLIVPLGDVLDRRRLIPALMVCAAVALAFCAVAQTFEALLLSLIALGLSTVSGQLLSPLSGDLARDDQRGHVVGTVGAGLLTGILLSRTLSGLIAEAFGWRIVYAMASCSALVLAASFWRLLPTLPPPSKIPYGQLLGSIFVIVRRHRRVQAILATGALAFGVFTMFWTGLSLLLSSPPFSYPVAKIGLVGLAGLAGAVAATRAGRLHDRGWSRTATGAVLVLALFALLLSWLGGSSIWLLLAAIVVLDIAIQALSLLNKSQLFDVDPTARSRLNTAFVVCNFTGGACGSAMTGFLWHRGGWTALMLACGVAISLALCIWIGQFAFRRAAGRRSGP